jgi:hypothetical protein
MELIRQFGDAAKVLIQKREDASRKNSYLRMNEFDAQLRQMKERLNQMQPTTVPSELANFPRKGLCMPEENKFSEEPYFPLTEDMIMKPPIYHSEPSNLIRERQEKNLPML